MSAAEEEVTEAIAEQEVTEQPTEQPEAEEHSIDIDAASDQIAQDLFGIEPKEPEEPEEEPVAEEEPEESTEKKAEEPTEEEPEEKMSAPQSWKKDMHEKWDALDKDTQEYINLREQQMKEGVEVKKNDADLGMKIRDAFAPYEQQFAQHGVDAPTAFNKLINTHVQLATAPMEQKKQLFEQLQRSYGITPQGSEEQGETNPEIERLKQELNGIKQNLTASQQKALQVEKERVESEVEAFASEHPHFDDLSGEIAKLIRAGYELDDAYKVAYRASHLYDKDIEKKQKEESEKAEKAKKQEAEKAKKARSVNVRGRDTKKAPTAPKGTMEDTLRDTMREIKNRN